MAQKELSIKLYRPKLGVGTKTLIALSIFFWIPVSLLTGILFYLFQDQFQNEAASQVKLGLRGAKVIYEEQSTVLKQLLPQLAQRADFEQALHNKNAEQLQAFLLEFSRTAGFVSTLVVVDEDQRVLARRGNKRGDLVNLGEVFSRAVLLGELAAGTELISREYLMQEDPELANIVGDVGVIQLVAAPVRNEERVVGAVVAGVLLTANPWLGDSVFERLGLDFTLFAGKPADGASLHTTSSRSQNSWVLGQPIPTVLNDSIPHGNPFYGVLNVAGVPTIAAFEPVRDSRNRVIGAIGVSGIAKEFDSQVAVTISKGLAAVALMGLIISLIVTYFVRSDITRPLNLLVEALQRFGKGDLDVVINIETGDQFEELGDRFNGMVRRVFQREERLKKHNAVAKLLMSTLDLDEMLDQTLGVVVEISESQIGVIYLLDEANQLLTPRAQYGTENQMACLKMGEGFPGQAAKDKRVLVIPSANAAASEKIEMGITQCVPKEVAFIPLVYKDRTLGVLVLGSVENYQKDVVQLFDDLADQLSIALDNAIMHHRIQEISVTDGLTGLYNRRFINERLEELWAHAIRHNEPLTILLSDIDDFKSINDTYGHDRGDEAICQVADFFKTGVRKEDLVARYGGEEFVVVMANTDAEQAKVLAERIGVMARQHDYTWADRNITLSIGLATFPATSATSHLDLVRLADQAMYKAKTSGKDQVVIY